ncbi:MAG TPA: VIT1/CCC1 transporter family protein [Acidimicrobiales bacterium]
MDQEHQHRNMSGGGARAAVFGISDGLVSNVSLILGMAGAHASAGSVRLAGIAGLIGGAFSMATGEYVSMRAQSELMERELDVERRAILSDPEDERRELAALYRSRGIEPAMAEELSVKMMRNPDLALETHAREELGFTPGQTGKPIEAALSSFVMFAIGALIPLLPWLLTSGTTATLWSVGLGAVGSLVVGAALSIFTGRSWMWSAGRQLLISGAAAGVTYTIGHLVGTG